MDLFKVIVGLLLGTAQIAVIGFCISHPHISEMYRQFYVTGQRDCWLPAGATAQSRIDLVGSDDILPARLPANDGCYLLMRGWDGHDSTSAWSVNKTAALDLPVQPTAKEVVLTFGALIPGRLIKLRFRVNGKFAGELLVPRAPGRASITFPVYKGMPADMIVELSLHTALPAYGIGLSELRWIQ